MAMIPDLDEVGRGTGGLEAGVDDTAVVADRPRGVLRHLENC